MKCWHFSAGVAKLLVFSLWQTGLFSFKVWLQVFVMAFSAFSFCRIGYFLIVVFSSGKQALPASGYGFRFWYSVCGFQFNHLMASSAFRFHVWKADWFRLPNLSSNETVNDSSCLMDSPVPLVPTHSVFILYVQLLRERVYLPSDCFLKSERSLNFFLSYRSDRMKAVLKFCT